MGEHTTEFKGLLLWIVVLCMGSIAAGQIPTTFQIPMLGYLFETSSRTILPITGIPGNSRIDTPLSSAVALDRAVILPDQRHAILGSPDSPEALLLNLSDAKTIPVAGAPSSFTEIRTSPGGSAAALYYESARRVLLVSGLPDVPVIRATIDVSFVKEGLRRFAVSDDGTTALLVFSSAEADAVYSWTASAGPRYVSRASRISDITFLGDDAVYVDAGTDQALLIQNVREQAAPFVIADSGDGVSLPTAVFISSRSEIYIGNSDGGILVLDATGHILRKTRCSCRITTMTPLAKSALRLTDRIDQPIFVLDGSGADRIFFIPALPAPALQGSGQ